MARIWTDVGWHREASRRWRPFLLGLRTALLQGVVAGVALVVFHYLTGWPS